MPMSHAVFWTMVILLPVTGVLLLILLVQRMKKVGQAASQAHLQLKAALDQAATAQPSALQATAVLPPDATTTSATEMIVEWPAPEETLLDPAPSSAFVLNQQFDPEWLLLRRTHYQQHRLEAERLLPILLPLAEEVLAKHGTPPGSMLTAGELATFAVHYSTDPKQWLRELLISEGLRRSRHVRAKAWWVLFREDLAMLAASPYPGPDCLTDAERDTYRAGKVLADERLFHLACCWYCSGRMSAKFFERNRP